MNKKELNELSDLIVSKLMINLGIDEFKPTQDLEDERHEEVHRKILNELIMGDSEYFITEEEMLVGELARLQTLMMMYEGEDSIDGYKKAAVILGKLKAVQRELEKL